MSEDVVGGCLCGAVRFEAGMPALFCAHCHCEWCRRAHGAAFVTWFGVKEEAFAIVDGEDQLRWFASTPESERGFCARCGTKIFFRSTLAPGEMHIALACADDASALPPKAHVFWEAHAPWIELADSLPRLGRDQGGLAKYQVIARKPS
jgi:hypothetical protein